VQSCMQHSLGILERMIRSSGRNMMRLSFSRHILGGGYRSSWTRALGTISSRCASRPASNHFHMHPQMHIGPLQQESVLSGILRSHLGFQDGQLLPESFEDANTGSKVDLSNRLQDGYDHSYFFIATFVSDHLRFHASHLGISG
jgi:hypothetical protein